MAQTCHQLRYQPPERAAPLPWADPTATRASPATKWGRFVVALGAMGWAVFGNLGDEGDEVSIVELEETDIPSVTAEEPEPAFEPLQTGQHVVVKLNLLACLEKNLETVFCNLFTVIIMNFSRTFLVACASLTLVLGSSLVFAGELYILSLSLRKIR